MRWSKVLDPADIFPRQGGGNRADLPGKYVYRCIPSSGGTAEDEIV